MARHRGRSSLLSTLTLAILLLGTVLRARQAAAQDFDSAGRHFANGQERYAQKRFHTAALEFQAAYDITRDPVLLYNVGDAWQRAGQASRAVAAYRAYLVARPAAQDRADVERRIAATDPGGPTGAPAGKKPKLADEAAPGDAAEAAAWIARGGAPEPVAAPTPREATPTEAPAPAEVAPPPTGATATPAPDAATPPAAKAEPTPQLGLLDDRPASRLRIAAWASVAATIALLTTGAILGLAAQSRGDEIGRRLSFVDSSGQPREFDAGAQSDYQSLKDEGRLYNSLAIGFYAAAGAAAIATTTLFLVDWKRGKRARRDAAPMVHVAPSLAPGAAGLVVGGSF